MLALAGTSVVVLVALVVSIALMFGGDREPAATASTTPPPPTTPVTPSNPDGVASQTPDPQEWRMVFNDEFDGDAVSTRDWNVRDATYLTYEESILTSRPENVRVGDGVLTIEARRERRTVGKTTRDYTSGYLETIGKHSWRYGRFEMRARLPMTTGVWPAFWLRGDNGPGEIDIIEAVGGMPRFTHQAVHQSTNGDREKVQNDVDLPSGTIDDWHVYAAEVEPDRITFFIDGVTVFTATTAEAPWLRETFDEPLNIRLNMQVGGAFPRYYKHPPTDASAFPATFEIDWIRVYQRP